MIVKSVTAGSLALIAAWFACVYVGGPFEEVRGAGLVLVLTAAVVVALLVSTWNVSLSVRMLPAVVTILSALAMTVVGLYGHAALLLSMFIGSFFGFLVAEIGNRLSSRR